MRVRIVCDLCKSSNLHDERVEPEVVMTMTEWIDRQRHLKGKGLKGYPAGSGRDNLRRIRCLDCGYTIEYAI